MVKTTSKNPIYAIAGPTASGKTEIGVELALRLGNGEIINCDSVQIYREIQIATAKPTEEEKKGVPHHLIDYVPPAVDYAVTHWAKDADEKIREVESRGKTPILVGGTGFYLRTLREPLFEGPKTDQELRARFTRIREKKGPEYLYKMIERIDPDAAENLFPRDYPRVQRALEVYFQTGEKLSRLQRKRNEPPEYASRIRVFVLKPNRKDLYARINERAAKHFENGLVEEVKSLRKQGLGDDSNALGSHGYRRVCEFLRGERSLESAIEKTQQDVRNYAKRQFSWFRREKNVTWLEGFGDDQKTQENLWELIGLKQK
ncbi:MAG: tRNA (adenosine(37)-N6)-dimethylallyltransferase MiaA [Pyrinomonadaceae bacterium]|nr:tRNA (adenosine(37)-N6)-dimethylallyltransferase MiaA [Pyrinomonadaceae bacterium]